MISRADAAGLHPITTNDTMAAAYSSVTLPNSRTSPVFWSVWAQIILNNFMVLFGFGFGVWAFLTRCSFGGRRCATVAMVLPLGACVTALLLTYVVSRPADTAPSLPVFLTMPVLVTVVMSIGLTPFLRNLQAEIGALVKHRTILTFASLSSAMFIASLLSGLIMQLYFRSSIAARVLIRLFVFPLVVEAILLCVRGVARTALGPELAAQNTLLFLLPPMLTASLVGRFLSTNLESVQETIAVSMAVASMEMLLRFTLPMRDRAAQSLRRAVCCTGPLHEPGTMHGRLTAVWEQRRWSHFHYAFMEMDSLCEDVGVLLALPITLLFAMPPAPGAAPLSAPAVVLRIVLQLIIESGTDLSAAWGAVCLRAGCRVHPRAVRVTRLIQDELGLPRLQGSHIALNKSGVLKFTPTRAIRSGANWNSSVQMHPIATHAHSRSEQQGDDSSFLANANGTQADLDVVSQNLWFNSDSLFAVHHPRPGATCTAKAVPCHGDAPETDLPYSPAHSLARSVWDHPTDSDSDVAQALSDPASTSLGDPNLVSSASHGHDLMRQGSSLSSSHTTGTTCTATGHDVTPAPVRVESRVSHGLRQQEYAGDPLAAAPVRTESDVPSGAAVSLPIANATMPAPTAPAPAVATPSPTRGQTPQLQTTPNSRGQLQADSVLSQPPLQEMRARVPNEQAGKAPRTFGLVQCCRVLEGSVSRELRVCAPTRKVSSASTVGAPEAGGAGQATIANARLSCCSRAARACRMTHGLCIRPNEVQAQVAAGRGLRRLLLAEAQVERASLWQHVPADVLLAAARPDDCVNMKNGSKQAHIPHLLQAESSGAIDDSVVVAAHAQVEEGRLQAQVSPAAEPQPTGTRPVAMTAIRRFSLRMAVLLEILAVRRMYAWELLPPGMRLYFTLAVAVAAVSVVNHSFNVQLRCPYKLDEGGYKFDFCTGL